MPETNFFWDPLSDNILQERDETGAVTAEYTTEPGLYGSLISQNRGGVESQYHFDALGSTLALTDDNQQVTDTYAYTAFGELTDLTGNTVNPSQYVGQKGYYCHAQTRTQSVRLRSYVPIYGSWLSPDPGGGLRQWSTYCYVANTPVTLDDPAGLQWRRGLWMGPANPKAAAKCEVTLVCWPAFISFGPFYHCEYRVSQSDWWFDYSCGCGGWHGCALESVRKCLDIIWIPPEKAFDPWTCKFDPGYIIPVGIPTCLGCKWSSDPAPYHAGWVESKQTYPMATCDCMLNECSGFPQTLCYDVFGGNSNTGAGCIYKKCGLTMPLPPEAKDKVLGWDYGCPAGFLPGVPAPAR